MWRTVLRTEIPGPDANFFALGGNSLQGARMISRLREELEMRIPLSMLFEAQTISQLTTAIEGLREAQQTAALTIEPLEERSDDVFHAPTSFTQQRLWVDEHIQGPSSRYNVPVANELVGPLDVSALEQAVQALADRHDVFRTTIKAVDGVPEQVIRAGGDLPLTVVDLRDEPEEKKEQVLADLLLDSAQRPFDVGQGPLLRVELYRLDEQWHVLLINLHHIITDVYSFELTMSELLALYAAASDGALPVTEKPPVQYADYAAWQRRTISGDALDRQLDYWKDHLRGPLPVLDLPTDLPPRENTASRGATVSIELPRAVSRRIRELSQENSATPFMTVFTLLNVLLSRYSGQTDIVVGIPSANRDLPELESMLGCFLNTLALRSDLSGDPTVTELLGGVRARMTEAFAHQDVPYERVVNATSTDRSSRQGPFRVMLAFQHEVPAPELAGLTVSDVDLDLDLKAVKFDLVFRVVETEFTYRLALDYNTDLFVEDKAWRILEHLSVLAADAAASPAKRVSELTILPDAERRQLEKWSTAACGPYPTDLFLHRLFEEQVRKSPDADAVESGDDRVSYRELDRRAAQLADELAARGIGTDDLVGLCADPSVDLIVGILGILKAGAAYVPIDPLAPVDRMAYVVSDSGMKILVTTPELREQLPEAVRASVDVVDAGAVGETAATGPDAGETGRTDRGVHRPALHPSQLVYLMYTSGTTGNPKGVGLPHTAITPWIQWAQDIRPIGPGTRVVHNLSYHFDWSVEQMFHALTAGACLVMLPREVRADGRATARFIDERSIHMLYLTPTQMRGITDANLAMPTLRHVSMGGENLDADLVARTRKVVSAQCEIWNEYGPTETAGAALVGRMGDEPVERSSMPLGELIANASCAVVDRWGNPQPIGVPGELWIGGDGVARGYRNRPALTADRFAPDPARPGRRLYRTGDLVRRLPNGEMEFLGRVDSQVKIRGVRVELEEIESVLRGHPDVTNAVVVLESGQRLVAYVAPVPGSQLDESALRTYLAPKLPIVMQPAVFMWLDAIPLSPTGKVDRQRLPRPSAAPVVELAVVAPSTETECTVAAAWADVLKLDVVSVQANFFESGGDSFSLLAVVSRLRNEFGLDIPVRSLVDTPTIATLAAQIDVLRSTA
ncbi:amino acid adenylation domain-containing protein [Streptomyces sp. NBC_00988]|uniref:non-ribosomal peptide synthetase n=1 Tax=Streptomyces sp. NBC_00988 TaxID=2903704 RepID=UPI00386335C9|nr:amino acid adenylation domain-containing protein [Streptomyces sp. NBC_00988]